MQWVKKNKQCNYVLRWWGGAYSGFHRHCIGTVCLFVCLFVCVCVFVCLLPFLLFTKVSFIVTAILLVLYGQHNGYLPFWLPAFVKLISSFYIACFACWWSNKIIYYYYSLPASVRSAETLASFKRKLKTLSVQHFVLTGFYHLLTL